MLSRFTGLLAIALAALSQLHCESQAEPRMVPAAGVAYPRAPARGSAALTGVFEGRVGSSYRLQSVDCEIDGYSACSVGDLGERFALFSLPLTAGRHFVTVTATYSGENAIFPYMAGFRFMIRRGEEVVLEADQPKTATFRVVDVDGPTRSMQDRLRMSITVRPGTP